MKFVPIEKQSNKQIKTHSKKVFKTYKKRVISFIARTFGDLSASYARLLERYKKVEFPVLSKMKQSGTLYSGAFIVYY